ncbi:MAG: lipopolysaccharide biosynthesis protein [Planctomycetota bacterium]|jgi:O-antigen/teichoic acid export membrane protein
MDRSADNMTDIEITNQKEHPDLYKRSIKGGHWVFAIKFATQLLGFVKSIIVFNFLFSENLELIFVANLLMAALTTFSESGFRAALVQKKDNIEDYLDTAWVIGILRGILLFVAIYFAAPLFASSKVDPEKVPLAISVIRAMGLCLLIGSFQNIGTVYFQKEMEFYKTFWLKMAGTLTDIAVSISLLLIFGNVWAVVVARLITAAVNLIVSYLLCPYRPKFHFIPEKAKELWKFGKWLFGGNIVGYLMSEGDDWFVLMFYSPDLLPFKLYRGAYRFADMPATYITSTTSQVSFPAYSKIQFDLPRLRDAYFKVLQVTALISIPVAFMIFTLGPDFVRLFLVKESHAMIPILQILAAKGLLKSLGSTVLPLFKSIGRPQIGLYINIAQLIVLAATIYPFVKLWGVAGAAFSTVFIGIALNPVVLVQVCRVLKCRFWDVLKHSLLPFVSSCFMGGTTLVIIKYLLTERTIISFLGLAVLSVFLYLVVIWFLDCFFNYGIRRICIDQVHLIRQSIKRNQMKS